MRHIVPLNLSLVLLFLGSEVLPSLFWNFVDELVDLGELLAFFLKFLPSLSVLFLHVMDFLRQPVDPAGVIAVAAHLEVARLVAD